MKRRTLALSIGIAAAAALAGCGMMGANVNVNTNANTNSNANKPMEGSPANVNANSTVNTNANTNANSTAAAKGPKRITFGTGSDWGSENVTLPASSSAQFVVGAKKGQLMEIEASSGDVRITMLTKGKSDNEVHPNGIGATLNANGDYLFEVRNLSKKEVKTSVKVTIVDGE